MSYRDDTLAGQPLTEREAEVLAAYDGGASDGDIAERFGYASANGAGNVRRRAMTKANRGAEVDNTRRARGGTPKVTTAEDALKAIMEQTEHTLETLRTRLADIESDANMKPADIIKREHDRLAERVVSAQTALSTFEAMEKPDRDKFVENFRTAAATRATEQRDQLEEAIAKANTEHENMVRMLDAIGASA